jgi:hypothetical protein
VPTKGLLPESGAALFGRGIEGALFQEGGHVSRFVNAALIAAGIASMSAPLLLAHPDTAQQSPAAGSSAIKACSLVPKEEVKKHLPWIAVLDQFPIEEEPVGPSGSSCNYPSVFIQVMPFSQGTIDAARKKGGLETISGVGDEAYFYNNANRYAELYVKTGKHMLTLQANWDGKSEAVRAGTLNLAKALVAKLR